MSAEQTSGALSGAASGAAIGTQILPGWGTAIGAVVGGIAGYFTAKKKPTYTPVDVNKLMSDARTQYADNYRNSIALEASANPQQAALRSQTNQAMSNAANQTSAGFQARNKLLDGMTTDASNPLLNKSADSIMQQLQLGGKLSPEMQNAIARTSLSTGAGAGLSGSFAGRGLVARDLGLTSMSLLNQRQQAAQDAGGRMQQLQLQLLGQNQSFAGAAAGLDSQSAGLLGSVMNQRQLPASGLDPAQVAGVTIGNNNKQNDYSYLGTMMDNKARADSMQALLSLGSMAAGGMGGGGGGAAGGAGAGMASFGSSFGK